MTPAAALLVFLEVAACARLAPDSAPATASAETKSDQTLKARFKVLPNARSSELLDDAMGGTAYQKSEIVQLNLKHVISTREKFKVLGIEKSDPDVRGYLTYTVTYQPMVPEVTSLFYTVKKDSPEESLLSQENAFVQDSLFDLFRGKRPRSQFTIVNVKEYTCWPREQDTDASGFRFRLCTHELQFKNPQLARAKVKGIDVNKKYTTEHGSKYNGMHFQINGEDAVDQNELTTLQSGVLSAVCHLQFVGAAEPGLPASHVTNTTKEVIAEIFGGSPSQYITVLQSVSCNNDNTCTVEIEWGEAKDASIHKFAMKKSVERANEDLARLTKSIFDDKWTIRKIRSREKKVKVKKNKEKSTKEKKKAEKKGKNKEQFRV